MEMLEGSFVRSKRAGSTEDDDYPQQKAPESTERAEEVEAQARPE